MTTPCYLDVNDLTAGAPLNILASNVTPIERVPAIVDFDLVPDMGRMTGRLPSIARTPYSPAPTAVPSIGGDRFADRNLQAPRRRTAHLADVITRIVNRHPQSRLEDLLPWAYPTMPQLKAVA